MKTNLVRCDLADAAAGIILKEGDASITVRSLAREAGYSTATLYNHFRDLDELLWLTRQRLVERLATHVGRVAPGRVNDVDDLVATFLAYAEAHLAQPHLFRFLFFRSLSPASSPPGDVPAQPGFGRFAALPMAFLTERLGMDPGPASTVIKALILTVHGSLGLWASGNDGYDADRVRSDVDEIVRFVVSKEVP